jgi:MFS family permease
MPPLTEPPQPEPPHPHDPLAALRFRDFRLILLGRTILFMGGQMQMVAIGWELYERTRSAWALGGIGLAQIIPAIALTLVAGHVADQRARKGVVLLASTLLVLCGLALAALSYSQGPLVLIYGCILVTGIGRAFLKPASDALMFQLIPLPVFTNASTWASNGFQLAALVGPVLGGLILALTGSATGVYLASALAILGCVLLTLPIREPQRRTPREPMSVAVLVAGAQFVWQNQLILAAISLDMFAVLFGGATALLPIFAKDILQVGPLALGWMQAAPWIGAAGMSLLMAYLPPMRRSGLFLLLSVAGFGLVTIAFGLSRSFWLSMALLLLGGALDCISVVIRHTLVQIRTPEHLRGRVAAINSIFINTSNELGGFESGFTAALFGPVLSVVAGGVATIVVVAAVSVISKEIRTLGTLQEYKS